jgi:hypothetical protein
MLRTIKQLHGNLDGAPALASESVLKIELANGSRTARHRKDDPWYLLAPRLSLSTRPHALTTNFSLPCVPCSPPTPRAGCPDHAGRETRLLL